MKKLLAPLLATALILGGTAAFAEDAVKTDTAPKEGHKKPHGERFKEADTNGDGFLTKEEMRKGQEKRLDEMFERTDANKDGKLSKEEMEKGRQEMKKRWKDHKDGKEDGPGGPPPEEAPPAEAK